MNYEEFLQRHHNSKHFAGDIGVSLLSISDGHAEAELPVVPDLFNPIGTIHGGVMYTLADTVCGCAALSRGQISTTIEGKLNHLRATTEKDNKLIGKADVLHFGKQTIVTSVKIFNDRGQTVAAGLFTYFVLDEKTVKYRL